MLNKINWNNNYYWYNINTKNINLIFFKKKINNKYKKILYRFNKFFYRRKKNDRHIKKYNKALVKMRRLRNIKKFSSLYKKINIVENKNVNVR